jgi:hypothetical protein
MSEGCVYIIKTGRNLYKIGKTSDLQKRLSAYHTHLPILFRVIRQYQDVNIGSLEGSLHIVFQHKRVKGEWFELTPGDLQICDNIAMNYSLARFERAGRKQAPVIRFSDEPLLQFIEAHEKYLSDYSRVAEDVRLGLGTDEIFELYEGTVTKSVIETVRRLLRYRTPNSEFLGGLLPVVRDLSAGMTEQTILEKYRGQVSRATLSMVKRILRNQLY